MNESYKELLVKREKGMKEALSRAACVVLTVVAGLLTLMTGKITFFIIVVVLGVQNFTNLCITNTVFVGIFVW